MSLPGLRRLAEDYVVEPTPCGSRLIWTLALEPHTALKPVMLLLNPLTARMIRSVARGMRSQVG
jgi:hypothetical protein